MPGLLWRRREPGDPLTAVNAVFQLDPTGYGAYLAPVLASNELNPLGPGKPLQPVPAQLASFDPAQAFAPHAVGDPAMARACEAGLWLLHNYLHRSHEISQEINTTTGSYWHGLMHRREKDFGNAKYWFRRVGEHPIFPDLCREAAQLAGEGDLAAPARYLVGQSTWDPFQFIDLCAKSIDRNSPTEELCRGIQWREWELLFDYCYHRAIA
jgi:hypothetical protein